MTRPSWDEHWMHVATLTAARSTCPRASVGCVLCIDNRIVSTGYNGAISGALHCADTGCTMHDGHCVRTVHAEANAIADAARRGVAVQGATAYVTHLPCINCAKLLVSAGIARIVYGTGYDDDVNMDFLFDAGTALHYMGVTK